MAGEVTKTKLPPALDEVEISLFGPGYGECILVHPGDGKWFVIDSCEDPSTHKPVALSYLDKIGVDARSAVQGIVATHWHDDHIRGLGETFRACKEAEFVCSEAINTKQFSEIVMAYGHRLMSELHSGVDEFREILEELRLRAKASKLRRIAPRFAVADKCLWRIQTAVGVECCMHALSPSDSALLMSKLDIAKLFPIIKETKRRILPFSENRAAVTLWFSVGSLQALLGADLEDSEDPQMGWSVIINSPGRPQEKASVFKIPHHGSKNAHNGHVWDELLESGPVAMLSPYRLGSRLLPTAEDVKRICSVTDSAYITAEALRSKVVKRDKTVEKMIKEVMPTLRRWDTTLGHIRVRARQGEAWRVDLFDEAMRLCPSKVD